MRRHATSVIFGRPLVKRFALCYRTVLCPVLSVTQVYCGQTVGWIKMPHGMEVGLGPATLCLMGTQLSPTRKGAQHSPHFSAHFAVARSPISAAAELLFFQHSVSEEQLDFEMFTVEVSVVLTLPSIYPPALELQIPSYGDLCLNNTMRLLTCCQRTSRIFHC